MRNLRDWLWADSPPEALRLLGTRGGRGAFLGGGTCLVARQDAALDFVVDLSRAGLDTLAWDAAGLRGGATLALQALLDAAPAHGAISGLLRAALRGTRTEPWRRQATLAGRLLEGDPGDLLEPCLLVLDARLRLLEAPDAQPRALDLEAGLARARDAARPSLVLGIEVPTPAPGWGYALESLARSAHDVPLAAVAAGVQLADGRIVAARLATSGLPAPRRAPHAERAARGCGPDDFGAALAALDADIAAIGDWRAGADYRSQLGRTLLGRALRRASEAALRGGHP